MKKASKAASSSPASGANDKVSKSDKIPGGEPPQEAASPESARAADLLGDEPIHAGLDDRLGRKPFALAIANTIAARQNGSGFVIGLYGAWGEGKTSVLHLVEEGLKDTPQLDCLWFNPWNFRNHEQLVEAFFQTLARHLKLKLGTTGAKVHDALTKYGTMLSVVPTELLGIPNIGKAATTASKLFSKNSLEELKTQIEEALVSEGIRIVVFIDDVDRLDSEEIQAVLKLVKLTGGFKNLIYVLAFDDQAVAKAVGSRYGGSYEAGRDFLEKIVQLPLRLPRANPFTVRRIALTAVDEAIQASGVNLSEDEVNAFRRYFDPVFDTRPRTLRTAKRYGNSLSFVLPLLKGEANASDLMLLEAIRVLYPDVYSAIPLNRDLFTGASMKGYGGHDRKPGERERLDVILADMSAREARSVRELLEHLFPPLEAITRNNHYGTDWESTWRREKRLVSEDYFDRYFQYSVSEGDVSDSEMDRFLSQVAGATPSAVSQLLATLLTPESAERIVSKLRARVAEIDPLVARDLVPALARAGTRFPGEQTFLSFSPFGQAVFLINALLRRLAEPEREAVITDAVQYAEPLAFAVAIWRTTRRQKNVGEQDLLLTEESETRVEAIARERLQKETKSLSLYLRPRGEAPNLLAAWQRLSGKAETEPQLLKDFDGDAFSAARLVASLVPMALDMASGLSFESELPREHYDLIGELIDHEKLFGYLQKAYGSRLGPPSHYPMKGETPDSLLRAAQGYAYLNKIIVERGVKDVEPTESSPTQETDAKESGSGSEDE